MTEQTSSMVLECKSRVTGPGLGEKCQVMEARQGARVREQPIGTNPHWQGIAESTVQLYNQHQITPPFLLP